ncbi:hypothetical protein GF336_05480 [Candidatus Woesearchaeota archaeon]|nr:hypothetical protein [Candidatus Woesearchaeota archaeon]
MTKNHNVKFLVSKEQFQRIKQNARARGHKTVSEYLRKLSLEKDMERELWIDKILLDIHNKVMQNE